MRGREGAAELGRVAELRPCRTPAPWRVHSASTSLRCVLGDVPEHGTSRSQYRTARPTRPGAVRRHNHPTRVTPQWGAPRVTRRSATLTPPTPYNPPVARSSLHTRRHSLSTHRHLRACKRLPHRPLLPPVTCVPSSLQSHHRYALRCAMPRPGCGGRARFPCRIGRLDACVHGGFDSEQAATTSRDTVQGWPMGMCTHAAHASGEMLRAGH